ncbi:MAG: TetR/AcrR family transcriptional regulator [Gaiellaceae bacterium]
MVKVETRRMTADERRESILVAALEEFAARGLHGTSTDDIARRAGISQPYLFRLFGTKKELFIASVERCMIQTRETLVDAAAGRRGKEALQAIGEAYAELLGDRNRLLGQMQAYAACDDPDVCAVVRRRYGELFEAIERVSGESPAVVSAFFAKGMLLNVVAAMDLLHSEDAWALRLVQGCRES